eukprot:TRINITY_DN5208_c0_g2_i1.p2 TRINITY_DN5208_c0_g2~~TRINITY_DN5208_c0_g2_i1.p2  ORF type:complete len:193 (-),score=77.56 TRINITY_DN5208_c0_g2_i1:479-1057(-)
MAAPAPRCFASESAEEAAVEDGEAERLRLLRSLCDERRVLRQDEELVLQASEMQSELEAREGLLYRELVLAEREEEHAAEASQAAAGSWAGSDSDDEPGAEGLFMRSDSGEAAFDKQLEALEAEYASLQAALQEAESMLRSPRRGAQQSDASRSGLRRANSNVEDGNHGRSGRSRGAQASAADAKKEKGGAG